MKRGGRWLPVMVLILAVVGLVGTMAWWSTSRDTSGRPGGMMDGGDMMDGRGHGPGVAGTGPVRSLDDADEAAQRFADRWDLRVGEVMEFDDGFYAELVDARGRGATEVLIDPVTGAVQLEYGPARMWNTRYGMHGVDRYDSTGIAPDEARRIADRWLRGNATGLRAGEAEAFPGYYTMHSLRGERVVGMLSVHAGTGEVWNHTWHGRFIRMREHSG